MENGKGNGKGNGISRDGRDHHRNRPRWTPNAQTLKEVENLAARGLTFDAIAAALGISHQTLYERKGTLRAFADAIKKGRGMGEAAMSNVVFDTAINHNNVIAAMFYLKSRCGWQDGSGNPPALSVNINGVELSPDAEVAAHDYQLELIRLLTVEERAVYVECLERAARRQRGELTMEPVPQLPLLEGSHPVGLHCPTCQCPAPHNGSG